MYYIKRAENRKSEMNQCINGIEYLTFPMLDNIKNIKHLFTTRIGGASEGIFSSMNLSFTRGDKEEAVIENYKRVANVLDIELQVMVCSDQTYTINIRRVTKE